MTRQHLNQWHPNIRKPDTKKQLLKKSLAHSGVLKLGGKLINLISISGINHVMNHSGIARLQQLQPNRSVTGKLKQHYPVPNEAIGRVALFTGCVSKALDKETLHASIVVLNHLGYEVTLPGKQTCCGAMHAHDGDYNDAVSLARKNIQAFDDTSVDAIITAATGCGAHLTEYHHLFNTENKDKPSADQFSAKVMDICHFINNAKWPKELKPRPLNKRVAVHEPCSLKNVLRQTDKVYKLLHKIPELELIPLPGNKHCCGAAGSYMLDHPEMADQLRQDKLDALLALKPDILVSSNIGCALHLAAGLRTQGLDIEVVHPITLLHRQLSA
jgi:glycolate oxidase iron-sulfur subunit